MSTFYSGCSPITIGCTLYTGSDCTGLALNGYYSTGGTSCGSYVVTGSGIVSSIVSCSYTLTIRARIYEAQTHNVNLLYSINYQPMSDPYDLVPLGTNSGSFVTSTGGGIGTSITCLERGTISGLIPGDVVYISCYDTTADRAQMYGKSIVTCPANGSTLCSGDSVITMGAANSTVYLTVSTNAAFDPTDPLVYYQC